MAERNRIEEKIEMETETKIPTHPRWFRCSLIAVLAVAAVAFLAPAAQAEFDFLPGAEGFDGGVTNQDGTPSTQAGAHPFQASASIAFKSTSNEYGQPIPDGGGVRNLHVNLPAGFVGNPEAIPVTCSYSQLSALTCPEGSQVGFIELRVNIFGAFPITLPTAIYAMEAQPGSAAAFGFRVVVVNQMVTGRVRSDGDYGVTVDSIDTSQALAVLGVKVNFWGVPADPGHDADRFCGQGVPERGCSSDAPPIAFLTNPTNCSTGPLTTTAEASGWEAPGDFKRVSFVSHDNSVPPNPVGPTGCENVPFEPTVSIEPTTQRAETPTGIDVGISVPSDGLLNPTGIAQAHLKKAVVRFPEGMTVNPSAAAGLGSCSRSEIAIGSATPPSCPASSRIGRVEIETPLLERPIKGGVYLAKQGENPFGSLLAIYMTAVDPERGVVIKLPGRVSLDPASGRLEATFDDNPQLPFSNLRVHLTGGDRATLMTPDTCGTKAIVSEMTPWSAADPDDPTPAEVVRSTSSFEITSGPGGEACPAGQFAPKLSAGTTNPIAGAYSPFVLRLSREDGTQRLGSLGLQFPRGLLGKLKGIPYCPDAVLAAVSGAAGTGTSQLSSPSCPAASRLGKVTVGAGAGPLPFRADTGRAYLAGPYKGAPLSLAVIAPAVAGPFDLGSVVVRNSLRVDPQTAAISVDSDPLPTILHGIPLDLRSIDVVIDRPEFTVNPTSCDRMSFTGAATSVAGVSAPLDERFQVAGCERLGFEPKLSLRFSGAPPRRGGYPKLTATLRMPKGGANIGKAVVTLPETEFLENAHIRTICTRVQYAADNCPKGSVYGYAKAWTPLLDKPLQGPVYLRSSNHTLPDLVASLDGQIHVDLAGRIDSPGGRIRNTFWAVPDAPVSKFVLTMQGGRKGLLANNTNLCKAKPRASARFEAQSGKSSVSNSLVKVAGCGKGRQ